MKKAVLFALLFLLCGTWLFAGTDDVGASFVAKMPTGCKRILSSIRVKVTNYGTSAESGFTVHLKMKGLVRRAYSITFTSPLAASQDTTLYFNLSPVLDLSAGGPVFISVYTDLSTDANHTNDTITTTDSFLSVPTAKFIPAIDGACLGTPMKLLDSSTIFGYAFYAYILFDSTGKTPLDTNYNQDPIFPYHPGNRFFVTEKIGLSASVCTDTVTKMVVMHHYPKPGFTGNDVCLLSNAQFTDTSSTASGRIIAWNWDFGNGKKANTDPAATIYKKAGNYNVKLRVGNSFGCYDSIVTKFHIDTVYARFSDSITPAKDTVLFYAKNTSYKIYKWDFGDGVSEINDSAKAIHKYKKAGHYIVTLTPTNKYGCSISRSDTLQILYAGPQNADLGISTILPPAGGTCADAVKKVRVKIHNYGKLPASLFRIHTAIQGPSFYDTASAFFKGSLRPRRDTFIIINIPPGAKPLTTENYTLKAWFISSFDSLATPDTSFVNDSVFALPRPGIQPGQHLCTGDTSRFMDSSMAGSGIIVARQWDLGNGAIDTTANPSTIYMAHSRYTLQLKIRNSKGCTDSIYKNVFPDSVDAHYSTGHIFRILEFTALDTLCRTYTWDFGDGEMASGMKTSHKYNKTRRYVMSLKTNGTQGCTATHSDTVIYWDAGDPSALDSIIVSPNPFSASTTIFYSLPEYTSVKIEIFDIHGRKTGTLVNEKQSTGRHSITFKPDITTADKMYILKLRILDWEEERVLIRVGK